MSATGVVRSAGRSTTTGRERCGAHDVSPARRAAPLLEDGRDVLRSESPRAVRSTARW